jgi:hypothetical protein
MQRQMMRCPINGLSAGVMSFRSSVRKYRGELDHDCDEGFRNRRRGLLPNPIERLPVNENWLIGCCKTGWRGLS